MERAKKASEAARRYSIYSIATGLIIDIAIIALVVVRFTVTFSSSTRYTSKHIETSGQDCLNMELSQTISGC